MTVSPFRKQRLTSSSFLQQKTMASDFVALILIPASPQWAANLSSARWRPTKTTSFAKSRGVIVRLPGRTHYCPWLHLKILFVKTKTGLLCALSGSTKHMQTEWANSQGAVSEHKWMMSCSTVPRPGENPNCPSWVWGLTDRPKPPLQHPGVNFPREAE